MTLRSTDEASSSLITGRWPELGPAGEPTRTDHVRVLVITDKLVEVRVDFAERSEADVARALVRFERMSTRVAVRGR